MQDQSQVVAISVQGLYKTFKLPHDRSSGFKQFIINLVQRKSGYEVQNVLKDVSFDIKKGEFFGIVGRNGSGKSTLLKLLASIYTPNKGDIHINGSLTPFIELGVGFNQELTGKENIFLNGALLGFSKKEMVQMYDEIVEFAELEKFMDQKLKNYSSGMQVRLAFSIAIRSKSDILLIDEVLAVGDASFQEKCYETFRDLKQKGTTIILVTHDMSAVLKFCDRAILINKGEIVLEGDPKEIADEYLQLNINQQNNDEGARDVLTNHNELVSHVKSVRYKNSKLTSKTVGPGDDISVSVIVENPEAVPAHMGIQIFNSDNVYCFGTNSFVEHQKPKSGKKENFNFTFKNINLLPGNYSITVATMDENGTRALNYYPGVLRFRVPINDGVEGIVDIPHEWS